MLLIIFSLFLMQIGAAKHLFLIGGALGTTGQIFTELAKITGKPLNPNNCDENWSTTKCPKVAVITSAAATEKAGDEAYEKDSPNDPSYYTLFKQNGFVSKHVSAHIDNYKKSTDLATAEGVHNLNIILLADIIFFNGGDQARHARTWLLDNGTASPIFSRLLTRYNNGDVVVSGTSAGTMIMSNPTYGDGISFGHLYWNTKVGLAQKSTKDGAVNGTGLSDVRNGTKGLQYQDNGGKMPGFTVWSEQWIFDSHFDARGRLTRLIPGLHDMKRSYGAGVDENTAFYLYDQGKKQHGKVFGQNGVWIVDNKNAKYGKKDYFEVQNINLWYLTSGDQISLNDFSVKSSKKIIKQPYYKDSINSTHVVDSYQMTKLITRLIDQTGDTNTGLTKTPSGYSSNTPHFQFIFSKGKDSKGYYENKKYTVQKIHVQIKINQNNQNQIMLEQ